MNRKRQKLNNIVKRVINEDRRLLTESATCNDDWDCGDGKWCGPHPPCEATACWRSGKGECAPIRNDGSIQISNGGDIEDVEVMAKQTAGGDCYCVRHNGNQDDGYTPGINRCLEWSADCGGKSVKDTKRMGMREQDSPANPCQNVEFCCERGRKADGESVEPVFDRYDEENDRYICKCPAGSRKTHCAFNESRIVKEEIVKAKRLMGYNPRLTLTEQGGGIPVCMGITAQGCPGTSSANIGMTTPTNKCATIDNIPVTASDQGRDIMAPMGGPHMTIQSVFPNQNGNGPTNVTSAPGPCPRPGGTTQEYCCMGGVTGGQQCMQVPIGTCTSGGTGYYGGPFATSQDCTNSGCGGGPTPSTYRCDGPGCMECLPPNQNHPMCIHTEPTCGGTCGGGTTTSGCLVPSLPNYNPNATVDCSGNPVPPGGGYGDTNCCGMPPPSTCNKSCKQLASNFKKKAQGKNCNWLTNKYTALMNKLSTLTPGTCRYKRAQCKVGVVKALRQQQGC